MKLNNRYGIYEKLPLCMLYERDQPDWPWKTPSNPCLLNFYERSAGLLFTAAKVRLWRSSATLAKRFLLLLYNCSSLIGSQRTKGEKALIYYCRIGDKIMSTEGRKINVWNGREKHCILSTPLAVNLNWLGWEMEEGPLSNFVPDEQ